MRPSDTSPDQKKAHIAQRSSPRIIPQHQDQRLSSVNLVPVDLVLENEALSGAAPIDEGCNNTSTDSVFVSSPPSSVPSDPRQSITDLEKSIKTEPKPPRLVLHSDGGAAVCRICHSGEKSCPFSSGEPLISPCHCRGSTGLYHRTCLERWLSTCRKDKCEICKYQYHIEREPRKLMEFLLKPGSKSIQRHIISDAVCWLVLTPVAIAGSSFCIKTAVESEKPDPLQKPTLFGLATFLIMTYLVWSVICLRYHLRIWRRWRVRNHRIRVLDVQGAKKKRSATGSDLNNNDGYQLSAARTPVGQSGPRVGSRLHSVGSIDTHYSTPWLSVHPVSPMSLSAAPFGFQLRVQELSAIFEPRPAVPMQEASLWQQQQTIL